MSPVQAPRFAVCVAEDRKSCEPGLRLLLSSLRLHCAALDVCVFYPAADSDFVDWARKFAPENVNIRTVPLTGVYGWNTKPHALLRMLADGFDEVVWIDSDIVVTQDLRAAFLGLNADVVVATEEALWGKRDDSEGLRARLWGFDVKRGFPFTLNSAVLRVTKAHVLLLERWKELLESPEYRAAQALPWNQRPVHMLGDQDVLTALMCGGPFANLPVKILERGRDIIQYFGPYGFTVAERCRCVIRGMPIFIHSQGVKPWLVEKELAAGNLRRKVEGLYLDLSPYTLTAASLAPSDANPCANYWTRPRTALSNAFRKIGFGYPPLVGLPLALAFDFVRLGLKVLSSLRTLRRLGVPRTGGPSANP